MLNWEVKNDSKVTLKIRAKKMTCFVSTIKAPRAGTSVYININFMTESSRTKLENSDNISVNPGTQNGRSSEILDMSDT